MLITDIDQANSLLTGCINSVLALDNSARGQAHEIPVRCQRMSDTIPFWNLLFCKRLMFDFLSYRRSSPCDHSRKKSGLVYTTTFVKTRLNCDLNFVMKSLGK